MAKRAPRPPVFGGGALVLHPDMRQQPGQQRHVDPVGQALVGPAIGAGGDAHLLGPLAQLPLHVLPFAYPQVVQVLATAQAAER